MSRFAIALSTCILTAVLGSGGAALVPTTAEAATASKADQIAIKAAIGACKSEAKGKKVKWLQRRKYVNNCVVERLKDRPNIDVTQMLKNHPDMKDLPKEDFDAN